MCEKRTNQIIKIKIKIKIIKMQKKHESENIKRKMTT